MVQLDDVHPPQVAMSACRKTTSTQEILRLVCGGGVGRIRFTFLMKRCSLCWRLQYSVSDDSF